MTHQKMHYVTCTCMYHFISGYTARVAGTEVGIKEPQAVFSACFGAPFMVWHPSKYAEMLARKMQEQGCTAWLVNTVFQNFSPHPCFPW